MKDTELRLGSMIKVDGEIQEVCELPLPENCTDENTKGIPLTEGWLVKFGFEGDNHKNNETFFIDISDFERPEIKTTIDVLIMNSYGVAYITDNEMDIDINTCFVRKIKHVHHLQNLYFALTGEELKIDES